MAQDNEAFLSRWSRRKLEADKAEKSSPPEEGKRPRDEKPPEARPGAQARAAEKPAGAAAPATELPPLDKLTSESDFGGFMKPGVDDKLRRAALKKLFADPRFNVIDGLDVYIDDYTKNDPIPPEMMKNLAHAKRTLFGWDEDKKEEAGALAGDRASEPGPRTAQADKTPQRDEEEGPAAQDEDDREKRAGKDEQSGDGPDQPVKKG